MSSYILIRKGEQKVCENSVNTRKIAGFQAAKEGKSYAAVDGYFHPLFVVAKNEKVKKQDFNCFVKIDIKPSRQM
ncbi:hypothetical protein DFR60_107188 [Hungatella effluvii]|uniref:Uncharacterized protein n=1 Tax=Hungatella effluvii TaxID=1096246 RepID=A0A2V3YH66_9FIRM|nr:hypothetical protein [Hungatella effluvii]PXX52502.1 hypothetical protein DFR60_107188 [Hungatella effluvii]